MGSRDSIWLLFLLPMRALVPGCGGSVRWDREVGVTVSCDLSWLALSLARFLEHFVRKALVGFGVMRGGIPRSNWIHPPSRATEGLMFSCDPLAWHSRLTLTVVILPCRNPGPVPCRHRDAFG